MALRLGEQVHLNRGPIGISVCLALVVRIDSEQLKSLRLRKQICARGLRHLAFSSSHGFADVAQSIPALQ